MDDTRKSVKTMLYKVSSQAPSSLDGWWWRLVFRCLRANYYGDNNTQATLQLCSVNDLSLRRIPL